MKWVLFLDRWVFTNFSIDEFLNLGSIDILGWIIPCCRGLACAFYKMFSHIPGLYLVDVCSIPFWQQLPLPSNCDNQKHFQALLNAPWGAQLPPFENHCLEICSRFGIEWINELDLKIPQWTYHWIFTHKNLDPRTSIQITVLSFSIEVFAHNFIYES